MQINETPIDGTFMVEIERREDERGFFARTWDAVAFAAVGIDVAVAEASVSYNRRVGTLRGLHFQADPAAETKLVRCTSGAIYDVVADLRESSPSYLRWHAVRLDADKRNAFLVPPGVAHGFQTLCDDSEVEYLISVPYVADLSRGVRWDDTELGIQWPMLPSIMSARDRGLPTVQDYLGGRS